MITTKDQLGAQYKVHQAIIKGSIKKGVCEICSSSKSEAHHKDYTKPLDIQWLCRKHHVEADKIRRIVGEKIIKIKTFPQLRKYYPALKKIEPQKDYNLRQIRDERLIPWALHYKTLRRIIKDDIEGENLLNAGRYGERRQVRYSIMGKNILKYKKQYLIALAKK